MQSKITHLEKELLEVNTRVMENQIKNTSMFLNIAQNIKEEVEIHYLSIFFKGVCEEMEIKRLQNSTTPNK